MATIVVGVDGSAGARRALRFACEEARLRGAAIRAVSVWHISPGAYSGGFAPVIPDVAAFEEAASTALAEALDAVGDAAQDLDVERLVLEGQAADVLVEQSEGADLLVVGSRGLGGFRGLLLGSVGQQCAHHARCPVVIVPAGESGGSPMPAAQRPEIV